MFATSHQLQMNSRKVRKIRTMEKLQQKDREVKVTPAMMGVVMGVTVPTQLHPLPHLLLPVPLKPMLTEKL